MWSIWGGVEGRSYGCVLTVLTGLHHIKSILVVYKSDSWGNCGVVDLSVAVGWMVLEAGWGLFYHRQSMAFTHAALFRPCLQNLLLHFFAVVHLRRWVQDFWGLSWSEKSWVDDIWFLLRFLRLVLPWQMAFLRELFQGGGALRLDKNHSRYRIISTCIAHLSQKSEVCSKEVLWFTLVGYPTR